MATQLQRNHAAGLMRWLIAHEPQIDYDQVRPMRTRRLTEQQLVDVFARGGRIETDCSETATLVCRLAGLADPNGHGYNGAGFTGDMLAHLPHYTDPAKAAVGALVVFGPGSGDHVCQVLEAGHDPLLFSHGQDAGPIAIRLSAEKRVQRGPVTFLNVSRL